jgi:hypothetical protein
LEAAAVTNEIHVRRGAGFISEETRERVRMICAIGD